MRDIKELKKIEKLREKEEHKDEDFFDTLELPDDFHDQNLEHNYFMELKLAIKKRSELKQIYDAIGFEQFETEKAIISLKKALVDTEEKLTKNPDSNFFNEQKAEIENYLAKINKILILENEQKENQSDIPGLDFVFLHYREFKNDLPLLKKHKYILVDNGNLVWQKSKKSLAEYFGYQTKKDKNTKWEAIERLFNTDDLKNSFSPNGSSYTRNKMSKDYEKWLSIKNTPKGV